ncbi:MAG: hypothetical protein RMK65_11510 [Anaerolineae bacterium]|nr:hypothetical protein [Anaerolineae bacterium]MCX8068392.1 hypothetical protein [Anaerolineae bacterium]MDW7992720.1 hypothetical protein [Anaerolineae bacterium]
MVTKRHLGLFLLSVALALIIGILAVDWMGIGEWGGFGPLQRIGVGTGAVLAVVALILIRLGDRPA